MDSGEKPARASGVIHDYVVDEIVIEKLHTLLLRQVELFLIDAPIKRALSSLHPYERCACPLASSGARSTRMRRTGEIQAAQRAALEHSAGRSTPLPRGSKRYRRKNM